MNETTSRKTNTTNYALIKPSPDDFYNVEDFNSNFDQIDKQLKANATRIEEIYDQTGNLNMAWDSITGKPGTFPPSSHIHTKSQISDFPSSMRANGGNADTVANKSVNDNGYGTNVLWTAAKIASEIANSNSGEGTVPLKHTHYSNDILDLHTVATSGSYTDLSNKPTARDIGAAEMNHGTHVSYATSSKPLSYGGVGSTGISGNVAREDHTHTLPSLPTASAYSSGMMSSSDKKKIDSLSTVATSGRYSDLSGIPSLFPPSTHTHTKSQISDFPSSLPANGGNADTVGGKHADDFISKNTDYLKLLGRGVPNTSSTNDTATIDIEAGNNRMCIGLDAQNNTRNGWVQVRHQHDNYATSYGTLKLNPLGGSVTINNIDILQEINNLKSSVSSGKNAIATAITGKGVSASGNDSHATLANKIGQIQSAPTPPKLTTPLGTPGSISVYGKNKTATAGATLITNATVFIVVANDRSPIEATFGSYIKINARLLSQSSNVFDTYGATSPFTIGGNVTSSGTDKWWIITNPTASTITLRSVKSVGLSIYEIV